MRRKRSSANHGHAAFMIRTCLVAVSALWSLSGSPTGPAAAPAGETLVHFAASKPFSASRVLLAAEITRPQGRGPFPAVVLMHGCGGWQTAVRHALRQHAAVLRDNGFVVLDLDSFGPRGLSGGVVCTSFKQLRQARDYRTHDAFDALRYLQAQDFVDPENIFLIGQSNGGSVAIKAARANAAARYSRGGGVFRGVVAYYPWCGTPGTDQLALRAPLMIFGGGRDDWVPPNQCQQFRATGAELAVTIYPGAAHSFDVLAPEHRYLGKRVGFNRPATEDSRRKFLAFFRNNIDERRYSSDITAAANSQ